MKNWMASLCILLGLTVQATSITSITYGGNGCPTGTVQETTNADGSVILEPAEFNVVIPSAKFDRKACDVAVAVSVPPGYSIAFNKIWMDGSLSLLSGMTMSLSAEAFFAGQRGPISSQVIDGPLSMEFHKDISTPLSWSGCGQSVILRLNTAVTLQSTVANNRDASVVVDKITLGAPLFKRCQGN